MILFLSTLGNTTERNSLSSVTDSVTKFDTLNTSDKSTHPNSSLVTLSLTSSISHESTISKTETTTLLPTSVHTNDSHAFNISHNENSSLAPHSTKQLLVEPSINQTTPTARNATRFLTNDILSSGSTPSHNFNNSAHPTSINTTVYITKHPTVTTHNRTRFIANDTTFPQDSIRSVHMTTTPPIKKMTDMMTPTIEPIVNTNKTKIAHSLGMRHDKLIYILLIAPILLLICLFLYIIIKRKCNRRLMNVNMAALTDDNDESMVFELSRIPEKTI